MTKFLLGLAVGLTLAFFYIQMGEPVDVSQFPN